MIAAVEGGLDLKARGKSAREAAARAGATAFLLDGFHGNGPNSGDLQFQEIEVSIGGGNLLDGRNIICFCNCRLH